MFLSQMKAEAITQEQIDEILFSEKFDRAVKSDYAILLGTAPKYASCRAKIAASFYRKGGTQKIIASGAAVSDKDITESAFMISELIKFGVPAEAIIEEPHAFDTIQNMTCSLTEICRRTNIMDVESITVVTEPFHVKRAVCLAELLLPKFISIYSYTEGLAQQRKEWKTDERLNNCVKNEIIILRRLIAKGRIKDIRL